MADATTLKYAIVEYTTQRNFLNVYDAIGIERLEWEVVSYDREKRIHLDKANAYLPVTKCKLLVHQVLTSTAFHAGWKLESFGGSFHKDGSIESRLFKVEYDPGEADRFARFPFRITINVGPGKRTSTGGIAPEGKPLTSISMRLPEEDFEGLCLEIRDFLLVHQRELEHVRRNEQIERFEQRRGRSDND